MTIKWHIEKRKINDLKHFENNPRIASKENLNKLNESIKSIGMAQPINITLDNVVLSGNMRLEVLRQQGVKEVEVYVPDTELTEKQQKEIVIRMNSNIAGDWDFDILANEWDVADLVDWGVEVPEIEQSDNEQKIIEDEVPEEVKTRCKIGDIWQLGEHRLMCGDSTKVDDVEKLMDGEKADMVFTDPPYGISVVNENGKVGSDNLARNGIYKPIKGDETTDTTENFYNTCIALGINNFIIWGGNYFTKFLPFSDSWLIWDKRGEMASNNFADGEMAWCSFHTPIRIYKQVWAGMIREGEHGKRVHPTQKPIKILADIIKDFTKEKDLIFDGFGGSGSTLLACEQTNRQCFIIEFEPYYCDVIITRWENLTGQKAIKIN